MTHTEFAIGNRKQLLSRFASGSLAIVNSNDYMPTNADGTLPFRQNNDLYWLTGIWQEDTTQLLFPDHPGTSQREILFIKYVDEQFVKWHGRRLSLDEASKLSGIKKRTVAIAVCFCILQDCCLR